jgi:hypothetical protein
MQVEVTDQIDVDDLAPERRIGVNEIHHPVPAGVVDQDADAADFVFDALDRRRDRGMIGCRPSTPIVEAKVFAVYCQNPPSMPERVPPAANNAPAVISRAARGYLSRIALPACPRRSRPKCRGSGAGRSPRAWPLHAGRAGSPRCIRRWRGRRRPCRSARGRPEGVAADAVAPGGGAELEAALPQGSSFHKGAAWNAVLIPNRPSRIQRAQAPVEFVEAPLQSCSPNPSGL